MSDNVARAHHQWDADTVSTLTELADLRTAGVLTDAEFEDQKATLLAMSERRHLEAVAESEKPAAFASDQADGRWDVFDVLLTIGFAFGSFLLGGIVYRYIRAENEVLFGMRTRGASRGMSILGGALTVAAIWGLVFAANAAASGSAGA